MISSPVQNVSDYTRKFGMYTFGIFWFMGCLLATAWAEDWHTAVPDYAWTFPQDHWAHEKYKTEWWYLTGHLKNEAGREFGYQFTFFRVGVLPGKPVLASDWAANYLVMGHAAIGDLANGHHIFSEVLYRATPLLGGFAAYPDTQLAWSRGPLGTAESWSLSWNGAGFNFVAADRAQKMRIALRTRAAKNLIFQGPNGYSRKGTGEAAASQYYSFTRLVTEGDLTLGEETFSVTGESWMDKEFGSNQLDPGQTGWDWFSLQLDDGREVMLYLLRDRSHAVNFSRGTLVSATGLARVLEQDDFEVSVTHRWQSPRTEAIYPAGWTVGIQGETWTIQPVMNDQENRGELVGTLYYWEGAVNVTRAGVKVGKGYVELTGYGSGSVPGL
ncbi:MAG: carotenoid 1,2-hydratase [bacterium]|nr:carotenoid 1,2-hydratase [bacterium]